MTHRPGPLAWVSLTFDPRIMASPSLLVSTPGWFCVSAAWTARPFDLDNYTSANCLCPATATGGKCPAGSFCPEGSPEPTPCLPGSFCATSGKDPQPCLPLCCDPGLAV